MYNLNLVQKPLGCKNWNDIKISGKESSKIFWTKKKDFIRYRSIPSFALGFSLSLKLVPKVSITSVMISLGGSLKKEFRI